MCFLIALILAVCILAFMLTQEDDSPYSVYAVIGATICVVIPFRSDVSIKELVGF